MKSVLIIGLTLLSAYEITVYFFHKICEIPSSEARHRLNQKIVSLWETEPIQPNADIFFCEAEWRELMHLLENYFFSIHLNGYHDNADGTISVLYDVSGILPKYRDCPDILKQSITYDTSNWIMGKVGYEVPIHVKTLSDNGLHLMLAYNQKGLQKFQAILAAQKSLLTAAQNNQKPQAIFSFDRCKENYFLVLGVYYDDWYARKKKVPIVIDLRTHCHILITGASGSGKSYALSFYVQQLQAKQAKYELWFADFKGSPDFQFLSQNQDIHYATGMNVYDTILAYYDLFLKTKDYEISPSRNQTLIIDEYPAFMTYLLSLDKKKADQIKSIIANLLMLGRDINHTQFSLILTAQRPDVSLLFQNGVRDNFMVWISLGNLSSEAKSMICDLPSTLPQTIYKQGEGLVKIDGKGILEIVIPQISNLTDGCQAATSTHPRHTTPSTPAAERMPKGNPRWDEERTSRG